MRIFVTGGCGFIGSNFIIEQITLGIKKETRDFYFIKEGSISKLKKHWASGIGSFKKDHILSHKSKRFKVTLI